RNHHSRARNHGIHSRDGSLAADMRAASAATMTASAAVPNKFYAWLSGIFAFLVEDLERRQADVRNLLFTESDSCAFAFLVEDVERRQRLLSPVFEVDVS